MAPPTGLIIAQTVGITTSIFVLGSNTALSLICIPVAKQAPALLAVQQWHSTFNRGGAIARPLAILGALATGYAAYCYPTTTLRFKLNIAATVLLPSIVPFTLVFIMPTNNALIAKKEELASVGGKAEAAEEENVYALMDSWAMLNMVRVGLVAAGALCAVGAVVL